MLFDVGLTQIRKRAVKGRHRFEACIRQKTRMESVKLMATLGGWNIDEMKGVNLPQKAQSAFTAITGGITGSEYTPVLYVGSQQVNGTNYCILAVQRVIVPEAEPRLVKMVINVDTKGAARLVSVSGVAL